MSDFSTSLFFQTHIINPNYIVNKYNLQFLIKKRLIFESVDESKLK